MLMTDITQGGRGAHGNEGGERRGPRPSVCRVGVGGVEGEALFSEGEISYLTEM